MPEGQRWYHREDCTRWRFSSCLAVVSLKRYREWWEGLDSEWRNSCNVRGFRDEVNGAGGRALEIKRPVDGLFSRAVMYDCSLEEWTFSLLSSPFLLQYVPLNSLFSLSFLRLRVSGVLPRRVGQFPCDKKVDQGGRYVRISRVINIYLSTIYRDIVINKRIYVYFICIYVYFFG